jgi:periplasmic protein TonB
MRFGISISIALFVTLALFYLMQYMISGSGQNIEKPEHYGVVDFVRLHREPEHVKSQPLKRIPPQKSFPPPRIPPYSMMKLAAGQPPATAKRSDTASKLMAPMHLGKPYLGPLTAVIPKTAPPEKLATNDKIKLPEKPLSIQKNGVKSASGVKVSSVDSEFRKSPPTPLDQRPLPGEAAAPEGAVQVLLGKGSEDEGEAVPVFKMEPKYPRKAAKSRIEGWVKVEFTITEKGTVTNAVIVDSQPRRTFDRSVIKSIRKWRFRPKIIEGRPVPRKATQVIRFKLAKG